MSAVFMSGLETGGLCSVDLSCPRCHRPDDREVIAALRVLEEEFPEWHCWRTAA